ncbi:MAG: sulfotransferase, partial [Deltaproteobacteria bacterium]|nr:sulfotransferase [Deltaproteobacteria bacterium]
MLEPIVHPLPSRVLNRAGALLQSAGMELLTYTPGTFKERAMRMAGLDDFGEPDYEAGLATLCDSVEKDARLLLTGRLAFRDGVTNALVTRLRRIEARKRSPEIFARPLVPPLIVIGLPRSGTTLLQRLLSLDEETRAPALWELQEPIAGPGPDRRRERSIKQVARMKKAAPGIDAKHHIDSDEPEEDVFLFDSSLWSLSFWMLAPVYGYLTWYLEQDPLPGYRVYREHLQLFQAENPGKRLTLKAPAHTGYVGALLEAVPEALVVQTHRDPVTVTNSVNSLFHTVHGYLTERVDIERTAAVNVDLFLRYFEWNFAAREKIQAGRILDIRYD